MLTRRSLVFGGSLAWAGVACGCCAAAQELSPASQGCYLAPGDVEVIQKKASPVQAFERGDEKTIISSGNKDFDFALAQTLAKLAKAFDVLPGFAFFDGDKSNNAYATTVRTLNRTDGSVFFGVRYLKSKMALPESPEVAVATICAHEFGHILQFKHGLASIVDAGQPNGKRSELQADYFAGFFTGLRKLERSSYPAAVAAMSRWLVGDDDVNSPDHHGTASERSAALVRGFQAAYTEKKSLSEAMEESTRYVMSL